MAMSQLARQVLAREEYDPTLRQKIIGLYISGGMLNHQTGGHTNAGKASESPRL